MAERSYFVPKDSWEGEHQSFRKAIEGVHSFKLLDAASNPAARLGAYNQATDELQNIIGKAAKDGKTLRAFGSSWSLSEVAVAPHRLINTKALRVGFTLPASKVSARYAGDRSKLRFLECGASIASINRYLFQNRLSLKASGSNNGQTLAGAISTGTHGSAFKFGSCQDFVVGIHLITGPGKHVYLERKSYPVVKPGFAAKLGADLIQDDVLFNAALVSFGSFGIIHGMMIEARELFLLHAHRFFHPYNAALKSAVSGLDFSGLSLPRAVANLYHFDVIFNPNQGTPPTEAIVTVMFEGDWTDSYQPPDWDNGAGGPGVGALEIIGELIGSIPNPLNAAVKPLLNTQIKDQFEPYQKIGIIRDLFRGEKVRAKNLSCGMGIDMANISDALSVAFKTYANFGPVLPLLISVRYVKGTAALLGFTRFDATCVLEIDAISTQDTRKFLNTLWKNLDQVGILFTLHWGKLNSHLTKSRVRNMYGDAVDQWKASRVELMEEADIGKVFTNEFTKKVGLTD